MPTSASYKARQLKLIVNYSDATGTPILNKTINALIRVYAVNGTLIKSSSVPKGKRGKTNSKYGFAEACRFQQYSMKSMRILAALVRIMTY
ncbi:MAG TPA: hypothetical protein VFI73_02170 [Candidatus Nitrosopolaris sp.]|nr:hypothetical protein [Candidatus Nitrosopolaris sp.]